MIMACGTGKTLASLFIAEDDAIVSQGGHVLFLVPSIALLSQAYREWVRNEKNPHCYLLVCSDAGVAGEDMRAADLPLPPTTDSKDIAQFFRLQNNKSKVIFCTYQSLRRIHEVQLDDKIPAFDLVICDEAHRTSGLESGEFKQIHDTDYIRAQKRLYMTATPRIYSDSAIMRVKERRNEHVYSMNDEHSFGKDFYHLTFSKALEKRLLSDYKVVIFQVSEEEMSERLQDVLAGEASELQLNDAAKIVGCYRALSGRDGRKGEKEAKPLKRVVSFANRIDVSQHIAAYFEAVAREAVDTWQDFQCEAKHIDGSQGIALRNEALDWLREDIPNGKCRIVSNAKCLTEGVDVPALDAVMFMQPRRSQVDVVQAVGRVMRKSESKNYGYIILPVVIPKGKTPDEALDDNTTFEVVWQVLKALRSHDDRFNIIINQIMLMDEKDKEPKAEIGDASEGDGGDSTNEKSPQQEELEQRLLLNFPEDMHHAIYGRIVDKCGDRMYWESWARDVARIYATIETRITHLVQKGSIKKSFEAFVAGLRKNINESLNEDDAISMLSQQVITAPVFEALFGRDDVFAQKSSIAPVMNQLLDTIEGCRS